jgi:excisionase family DNA binding protein
MIQGFHALVNTEGNKMHDVPQGAMLKPDEAHALVGKDQISRRAFYNALNRREIPCIRVGRRLLIPRHAFMKWLRGGSADAEPSDQERPGRHV